MKRTWSILLHTKYLNLYLSSSLIVDYPARQVVRLLGRRVATPCFSSAPKCLLLSAPLPDLNQRPLPIESGVALPD